MRLMTTLGPLEVDALGSILPHEHVVADLRPLDEREPPSEHRVEDIVNLTVREVRAAQAAGVTAIVDATPVGVGRRPDAVEALSAATGMPFAMATGIYREPWIPDWVKASSSTELTDWMLRELEDHIDGATSPAAWIKVSAGDDGLTSEEERVLRAAAHASRVTGCAIGSHTIRADVVETQLGVLESEGFPIERFVWIHTQLEPDFDRHLALADRGVWVEYDGIGTSPRLEEYVQMVGGMVAAGHADRLLLSQDSGWYDAGNPQGGLARGPYTAVHTEFLPLLRERGFDDALIGQLTKDNPFRAFARP